MRNPLSFRPIPDLRSGSGVRTPGPEPEPPEPPPGPAGSAITSHSTPEQVAACAANRRAVEAAPRRRALDPPPPVIRVECEALRDPAWVSRT